MRAPTPRCAARWTAWSSSAWSKWARSSVLARPASRSPTPPRSRSCSARPDTVVRRLSLHQPVTISTAAYPNERFPGRITRLAPAASPGSLVFDVEVTIPNRRRAPQAGNGRLVRDRTRAGAGTADGAARRHPALAAPTRMATRSSSSRNRTARTRARLREVTLGEMVAIGVTVTSGLRQGERVIVSGATIVADGEAVEILR